MLPEHWLVMSRTAKGRVRGRAMLGNDMMCVVIMVRVAWNSVAPVLGYGS